MPPIGDYALVGGIAAVCSYLLTFPLRRLATRFSFIAAPDERRVHQLPIPYGGGLAMFVAFLIAIIFADHVTDLRGIFQGSSEPLGVVLGAVVILGVGLLDDAREISAPAKVAGQVPASTDFSSFRSIRSPNKRLACSLSIAMRSTLLLIAGQARARSCRA